MDGISPQLALIVALVLVNALLSGSEIAFLTVRQARLSKGERESRSGHALASLAADPNRFLATVQVGVTLTGFLAAATAAVALAEPLARSLGVLGAAAEPTAVLLVTLGVTLFTLVVGELAPKRLAMQSPERWSLRASRPLSAAAWVATPVIWALSRLTDRVVALLGGDPAKVRERVTRSEIRELVSEPALYTGAQREIIHGALRFTERTLREVLVPRPDIVALPDELPAHEGLRLLVEAGHSRAPVYRERLDAANRQVSVLSLVGRDGRVADHATTVLALPDTLEVVEALRTLQANRQQLSLVVDEYGGVAGLVTVEDLVEELVGEIRDEHDREVEGVRETAGGGMSLPGRYPVHDLPTLGIEPPATEATTVGGLVAERLGRLPEPGDTIELDGRRVTVESLRRRRVQRLRIDPNLHSDEPPDL